MIQVTQVSEERTYVISSCNHLSEVKANKNQAKDLLDMFCTITAVKDYNSSSIIKIQNHQISQDLLLKVLQRTISQQIQFSNDQQKILQPYRERMRKLSQST